MIKVFQQHLASVLLIAAFVLLAVGSSNDNSESGTEASAGAEGTSDTEEASVTLNSPEELKARLSRENASLDEPFNNYIYDGSLDALHTEIAMFVVWAGLAEEGQKSTDAEIVDLAKELKGKVSKLQSKEFPVLRKKYAKLLADQMWEHDVEIKATGAGNSTLELTGGMFAANRSIKEVQTTLQETLVRFRFKQTRFRWYSGDNEYTYYELEVPGDKEVLQVE